MDTTNATYNPRTQRSDLSFWLDQQFAARESLQATINKYGRTQALETAVSALNDVIREYRHRMHELTEEMRA